MIAEDVRDPAFASIFVIDFFKSPCRLEAENLFLRYQLSIALRRAPPRLRLRGSDWALTVSLPRLWPSLLGAAHVAPARHEAALARASDGLSADQGRRRCAC